jgi:predicted porin
MERGKNSSTATAWTKKVSKSLIFPLALAGLCVPASAADLVETLQSTIKDGTPLTWNGITLYGNIDIGAQYESHGASAYPGGFVVGSQISTQNNHSLWEIGPSQATLSYWGIKVEEPLGKDATFIAKLESGFSPTTGQLYNALATVKSANGIPTASQNFSGDGSRAGQLFNGEAWGGFSHPLYGTLTLGRQYSTMVDAFAEYDQLISLGFSMLGYYGTLGSMGGLEAAIMNDTVKYKNKFGPINVEVLYSNAGDGFKDSFQGKVGFDYGNFSASAVAGEVHDSIIAAALGGAANLGSNFIGAKVADNTAWGAFGKYTINLGSGVPIASASDKGTYKATPPSKIFTPTLVISGGYENIRYTNPADGGWAAGHFAVGGYELGPAVTLTGLPSAGIVNNGYTGGDRILQVPFLTARYTWDPQWTAAVGWYRQISNSWGFGVPNPTFYSPVPCSSTSFLNCSGYIETESFRVDYAYDKHLTLYAGITYSSAHGGSDFGFLSKDDLAPTVGLRYQF